MSKAIDPEVVAIQSRIFENQLRLGEVLNRAGVNRSTWARWVQGAEPLAATLRKVRNALDAKVAEKQPEAPGALRPEEKTHG